MNSTKKSRCWPSSEHTPVCRHLLRARCHTCIIPLRATPSFTWGVVFWVLSSCALEAIPSWTAALTKLGGLCPCQVQAVREHAHRACLWEGLLCKVTACTLTTQIQGPPPQKHQWPSTGLFPLLLSWEWRRWGGPPGAGLQWAGESICSSWHCQKTSPAVPWQKKGGFFCCEAQRSSWRQGSPTSAVFCGREGRCTVHYQMFSSIPGLYRQMPVASTNCDNQKCLQTLQNVPWQTEQYLIENMGNTVIHILITMYGVIITSYDI